MPDKESMRLGAIILAGGRSARMGRAKDALPWRGRPLLAHVVAELERCCDPITVVARDAAQALPPLPPTVTRLVDAAGTGPLAGLLTGLAWHRGRNVDAVFVTACDHPFVSAEVVRWLAAHLADHDAVVPRTGDAWQPLCAIWRTTVVATAERLLATGAGPRDLALAARTRVVEADELRAADPELRCLRDVDTPDDWNAALSLARESPP